MRLLEFCLSILCYVSFGFLANGLPVEEDGARKPTSKDLDWDKIYPPSPPVTHRVLLTIEYYDQASEKLETNEVAIDLYGTNTPKTVKNFATLCVGMRFQYQNSDSDEVHSASFKGSIFHRIVPSKLIQGGDIFERSMPLSIWGHNWNDENFSLKHDRPGRLSMYNTGPNSQGSEFFITTDVQPATEFDMKNVVFGQVVSGLEWLIDKVQYVPISSSGKPTSDVRIKYIYVDELILGDKETLQTEYEERLSNFSRGDSNEGVTLRTILKKGKVEEEELEEQQFDDLSHPLKKILIGVSLLGLLYALVRLRRFIVPKTSKIVSMRHE